MDNPFPYCDSIGLSPEGKALAIKIGALLEGMPLKEVDTILAILSDSYKHAHFDFSRYEF